MQLVLLYFVDPYRLKRSQSNMECYLCSLNPAAAYLCQNFGREVQASSRSGHGSPLAGIDRLVALAVSLLVRAVNVRRQRDVAQALDQGEQIGLRTELNMPLTEVSPGNHRGL